MSKLLSMTAKDLRRGVRDRSAVFISIGAPLLMAFILSTVLGGAGDDQNFDVTYGVVDLDGGTLAQVFTDDALGGLVDAGIAETRDVRSAREARRLAEDDEIAAAFIIPDGFSESVPAMRGGTIEVVASPESEIGAGIARSVAQQFASELNAVGLSIGTAAAASGQPPSPDEIEELSRRAAAIEVPIRVSGAGASSREFDADTFFSAGMAVFFLFFTAQAGAISLLRERREGTLARLMVAPIGRGSIIASKALFTFVLGIVSMTVLVVASKFLLGANWGDTAGVALLIVAGVFAATGLQSLVTTLATTDEQASGYGSLVAVTLGLLGGTFFPIAQGPGLIADLSFVTPHAWLMRGLGELSGGAGSAIDVLPALGALALFGAITGAVALIRATRVVATR